MDIKTINTGTIIEAYEKWHVYVDLCKQYPKDETYKALRDVYNQAKRGHKLIDVPAIIQAAGVRPIPMNHSESGYTGGHIPKLAICRADAQRVDCDYLMNGIARYGNRFIHRIEVKDLASYTWVDGSKFRSKSLSAPVPKVPVSVWNKKLTAAHYILWEVDKWDVKFASEDPYLLKRITKNIFTILGQWELTELEQLVMNEYL